MPEQLVVTPEVVARRLGVTNPLTTEQREQVTDAILDAQADAEAVINRPLFAEARTVTGVYPRPGYDLDSWRAWPTILDRYDDAVTVTSHTAAADGTYTVDVLVGIDGPNEAALVRYVRGRAVEALRNDPGSGLGSRYVSSLSVPGQSVSYDTSAAPGEDAPGRAPSAKTLRHLKRHGVWKANRADTSPWPYDGAPVGYLR